ncbi:MAG: histidine phosphatase family protein [Betaproteobacteria bacterium]
MRLLALLALVLWQPLALADEALWKLLAKGGQVLVIRHALTTPGVGDPTGFRLEDCATQRNLSDEGRDEARKLGAALKARRIPLGQVLSSPWCRCVETARLAFDRSERWDALSNVFGRPENVAAQLKALRPRVAAHRGNENLVLVTHGSTTHALTGVSPATGEIVVLSPGGREGFRVAGRMIPWN